MQAYLQQEGKVDGSETVSNEYQKLYYHRLGTEQTNDVIVAEFDDPHYRMYLFFLCFFFKTLICKFLVELM